MGWENSSSSRKEILIIYLCDNPLRKRPLALADVDQLGRSDIVVDCTPKKIAPKNIEPFFSVEHQKFMGFTDAAQTIGRWVEHYHHRRIHHGPGELHVPAEFQEKCR